LTGPEPGLSGPGSKAVPPAYHPGPSGRPEAVTQGPTYATSAAFTPSATTPVPPSTTTLAGLRRVSSAATTAWIEVSGTSRIGPPTWPATAAPARASAK